jgi:hypothetical protein
VRAAFAADWLREVLLRFAAAALVWRESDDLLAVPRGSRLSALGGLGTLAGNLAARVLACPLILRGFFADRSRAFGGREFYAGAAGFGESYGDRLLRRSDSVFAYADVMNLFTHEFSCLGGW